MMTKKSRFFLCIFLSFLSAVFFVDAKRTVVESFKSLQRYEKNPLSFDAHIKLLKSKGLEPYYPSQKEKLYAADLLEKAKKIRRKLFFQDAGIADPEEIKDHRKEIEKLREKFEKASPSDKGKIKKRIKILTEMLKNLEEIDPEGSSGSGGGSDADDIPAPPPDEDEDSDDVPPPAPPMDDGPPTKDGPIAVVKKEVGPPKPLSDAQMSALSVRQKNESDEILMEVLHKQILSNEVKVNYDAKQDRAIATALSTVRADENFFKRKEYDIYFAKVLVKKTQIKADLMREIRTINGLKDFVNKQESLLDPNVVIEFVKNKVEEKDYLTIKNKIDAIKKASSTFEKFLQDKIYGPAKKNLKKSLQELYDDFSTLGKIFKEVQKMFEACFFDKEKLINSSVVETFLANIAVTLRKQTFKVEIRGPRKIEAEIDTISESKMIGSGEIAMKVIEDFVLGKERFANFHKKIIEEQKKIPNPLPAVESQLVIDARKNIKMLRYKKMKQFVREINVLRSHPKFYKFRRLFGADAYGRYKRAKGIVKGNILPLLLVFNYFDFSEENFGYQLFVNRVSRQLFYDKFNFFNEFINDDKDKEKNRAEIANCLAAYISIRSEKLGKFSVSGFLIEKLESILSRKVDLVKHLVKMFKSLSSKMDGQKKKDAIAISKFIEDGEKADTIISNIKALLGQPDEKLVKEDRLKNLLMQHRQTAKIPGAIRKALENTAKEFKRLKKKNKKKERMDHVLYNYLVTDKDLEKLYDKVKQEFTRWDRTARTLQSFLRTYIKNSVEFDTVTDNNFLSWIRPYGLLLKILDNVPDIKETDFVDKSDGFEKYKNKKFNLLKGAIKSLNDGKIDKGVEDYKIIDNNSRFINTEATYKGNLKNLVKGLEEFDKGGSLKKVIRKIGLFIQKAWEKYPDLMPKNKAKEIEDKIRTFLINDRIENVLSKLKVLNIGKLVDGVTPVVEGVKLTGMGRLKANIYNKLRKTIKGQFATLIQGVLKWAIDPKKALDSPENNVKKMIQDVKTEMDELIGALKFKEWKDQPEVNNIKNELKAKIKAFIDGVSKKLLGIQKMLTS